MSTKRTVEATPRIKISDFSTPKAAVCRYGANLDVTYPYFGGKRFWFLCSCGRRVSALYQDEENKPLRCRTCSHLLYRSQGFSGASRQVWRLLDKVERLETVFSGLQRVKLLHTGQLTKRFQRYLSLHRETDFIQDILNI